MPYLSCRSKVEFTLCTRVRFVINGDRNGKFSFEYRSQLDHFPAKVGSEEYNTIFIHHPGDTYSDADDAVRGFWSVDNQA
ncbi:hypothetical protein D3C71_1586760 [compost metagenome]